MPDAESWSKYGFPDHIYFRTMYLPTVGLIKALNERLESVKLETLPVPEYFSTYEGSQYFLGSFDSKIFNHAVYRFVKPDKVSTAQNYYECFWSAEELELAAADEIGENIFTYHPLMPDFPFQWAMQRYNAINLLRYVVTSDPQDWPLFTYTDLNNSFKFKA